MNSNPIERKVMQSFNCLVLFPILFLTVLFGNVSMILGQDREVDDVACFLEDVNKDAKVQDYAWTRDHMHVGVRWQPFFGRPLANAYDAKRPVISVASSYAQFWVSWSAMEPTEAFTDYVNNPSPSLKIIEKAVEVCNEKGIKVEFVFFHCPAWASESGKAGGFKPKKDLFQEYVKRIANHFKGRVDAYQLSHESNLQGLMNGADIDFIINDILIAGAQAVRTVYEQEPATPVIVSTNGMSPCENCPVTKGLSGKGGFAVDQFYSLLVSNPKLMNLVDALNLNVSDQNDGFGNMDGSYVPSVWGNYDLARGKLDAAGYQAKAMLSAESWISWDDGSSAVDVNGDGLKNEVDAYDKAVTIIGQCLQRGLNTINLPWSDNSSSWSMGLTKRRDYNGRIAELQPEIVIEANDGGAGVVTTKVGLRGPDDRFEIGKAGGNVFTVDDYINPPDPNHLHYYVWKWYAQISSGRDEVIRHAMAGEVGNDIAVTGRGFTGNERYRISSYNRSENRFTVLVYSSGANGKEAVKIKIPAQVQAGKYYNNESSVGKFKGEGFPNGSRYYARVITKNIDRKNGADRDVRYLETKGGVVQNGVLEVSIPKLNKFTAVEFVMRKKENPPSVNQKAASEKPESSK